MQKFPSSLQNLLEHFSRLPGVGPKTALRFVFYLLKQPKVEVEKFAAALGILKNSIVTCGVCQNFSEKNPCAICADQKRDHSVICVVAEHQDLPVIENTGEYHGTYHVLGGVLDPLHGVTPDQLKIKELVARINDGKKSPNVLTGGSARLASPKSGAISALQIREIILALNPDLEGETTMLYLTKLIKSFGKPIKITRLARGLPMGSDLEYADEVTVSDALKGRKEM
jgi:recombination protein RecR